MKSIDVFDSNGDWLGTEFFADDFPDELILTFLRTELSYPPSVWMLPTSLVDAGVKPARIEYTPSLQEGPCCSFCGRHKDKVQSLVEAAADPSKAICGDCIHKLKGRAENVGTHTNLP